MSRGAGTHVTSHTIMKTLSAFHVDEITPSARWFERETFPHMWTVYSGALMLTADGGAAEKLVEETYAHAWRRFRSMGPVESIRTWMLHLLVLAYRAHSHPSLPIIPAREGAGDGRQAATMLEEPPDRREGLLDSISCADVRGAYQVLPAELRLILWLVGKGLRYRQVARILEVSPDDVSSKLLMARRALSERLLQRTDGHDKTEERRTMQWPGFQS